MEHIVPELRREKRRELIRVGRKSGDPDTANRFAAVAKLAGPDRPSRAKVARELMVAVSTVVNAARRYIVGGVELLYDQRVHNGRGRKIDDRFSSDHLSWQPCMRRRPIGAGSARRGRASCCAWR